MRPRRIEARAPTRIDLSGGTIDIWPLYLLHERPLTVNAAIDLAATALVETLPGPGVEILSVDRGREHRVPSADRLQAAIAEAPPELEFILRLAAHFLSGARSGCRITTECRVPAGSGLGGSSALGIALSGALDRFSGRRTDPQHLLDLTRAIETQTLRIPTGEQDYHPALHGGPLALHYTVEGTRVERLSVDVAEMARRTVLIDSGTSRSSGISNWDMVKRHLDGDPVVREAMREVIAATHELHGALTAGEYDRVGASLAREWAARKRLSPAVTDEVIDRLIRTGLEAGALAGKVCGAGGGGCVVLWTGGGRRGDVVHRLRETGARILEFRFERQGLRITET